METPRPPHIPKSWGHDPRIDAYGLVCITLNLSFTSEWSKSEQDWLLRTTPTAVCNWIRSCWSGQSAHSKWSV